MNFGMTYLIICFYFVIELNLQHHMPNIHETHSCRVELITKKSFFPYCSKNYASDESE